MYVMEQVTVRGLEAKEAKKVLLVVITERTPKKVFDSALEIAREEGATIFLAGFVDPRRKVPGEFIEFVKTERLEGDPRYHYLHLIGREMLKPYEEALKREGIEYESYVEFGNPNEALSWLVELVKPKRIVIGLKDFLRREGRIFKRSEDGLEGLKTPITIIP